MVRGAVAAVRGLLQIVLRFLDELLFQLVLVATHAGLLDLGRPLGGRSVSAAASSGQPSPGGSLGVGRPRPTR